MHCNGLLEKREVARLSVIITQTMVLGGGCYFDFAINRASNSLCLRTNAVVLLEVIEENLDS